ncbi:MAG: c-type cytochrome [bacterium]
MRMTFIGVAAMVVLGMLGAALLAADNPAGKSGETLFQENCAVCHPAGGNILNPTKTLFTRDLEKNGIQTPQDIVRKMRNPGAFSTHPQEWSGMKMFDEKAITDEDALKIAEYILSTFR